MGAAGPGAAAREVVNTKVPARIVAVDKTVAVDKVVAVAKVQEITGIPGSKTPLRLSQRFLACHNKLHCFALLRSENIDALVQ